MTRKTVARIVGAATVVAGTMGGCRCGRDVIVDEATIDEPPLVEEHPDADRPRVYFPRHCQTDEVTLNRFIDTALTACERGDYDTFRQMFGTAYNPTGRKDFERFWRNVQEISVASVRQAPGKTQPPRYYMHTVVRLREPDRRGRTKRDAVVVLFQELDEWRMVPAPKEIIHHVLIASTQPATQPAGMPVFAGHTE